MKKYTDLMSVLKEVRGFYGYLTISSIIRTLSKLSSAITMMLVGFIISGLLADKDVSHLLICLVITIICVPVLSYLDTYTSHDLSFRLVAKIKEKAYDKIDEVAPAGLVGKSSVDYLSTISQAIDLYEIFYAHILIEWIGTIFALLILLFVLAKYSLLIFGISFICIILNLFMSYVFSAEDKDKANAIKTSYHKMNEVITESILGIKDAIGYNMEKEMVDKLVDANKGYQDTRYIISKKHTNQKFLYSLILFICLALTLGVIFIYDIKSSVMVFLLVLACTDIVQNSLSDMQNISAVFSTLAKVNEIFALKPLVVDHGTNMACGKEFETCDIKFRNVKFAYDNENLVINELSLELKSGKTTAIVGSSGCGKTTISKLIQRFWDVDSGEILINNTSSKDIKLERLQSLITSISQDIYLFNGTIKDNILLAKPDATDDEIKLACKKAEATQFINEFSDGIDTQIGQNGVILSGGQRQRIALTWAFLRDTPILIFDEATSALDSENESKINQAIKENNVSKTIVVIAHRLSTMKNADEIIFIKDGKLFAKGEYNTLIKIKEFCELVVENEK